jgi:hypothetical protein
MGNTYTRNLGVIKASAPPRANIAPEAPITIEKGDVRKLK